MGLDYLDIKEAESIAGARLDRRRKYFMRNGVLSVNKIWRGPCSGCSDDSEYATQLVGNGCSECGYHGVRIMYFTIPV